MSSGFWNKRAEKYGHTGWSDTITYFYDQNMRLNLIENVIKKYFPNSVENSLDYGCGSGDFSNLLSKYSHKVVATDISDKVIDIAQEKYKSETILFTSISSTEYQKYQYGIINLITVLQHILEEDELINRLKLFNKLLSDKGIMIIIDSYGESLDSEYLKLRDFKEFSMLLKSLGFEILERYSLYHPSTKPTKIYKAYSKSYMVRILNRLNAFKYLNKISKFLVPYDNPIMIEETKTKLMIVGKIQQ